MNDAGAMASAMLQLQESLGPVIDLLTGYRTRLIDAGFTVEAAESMTVQLHSMLISVLLSSIGGRMG